jgi:predicted RND superfamily exporter protein
MDHQRFIDWADDRIVQDSRKVVLTFLVITLVFAGGLGNISTEAGTQQFATGLPAEEALNDINREFSPAFSTDTGNTQLIQRGTNVLSKESLLRMLKAQDRLNDHPKLRVSSTSSSAGIVATQIEPTAQRPDEQINAIEHATPAEIDAAVRAAAANNPQFTGLVSNDFNRADASASATIGLVVHELPAGISSGSGQGGSSPLTPIQQQAQFTVQSADDGSITVFGTGIISAEFATVITDSLLIVVPAAVLFIFVFLAIAYRDPLDLMLGLASLLMTIIWTFGFMGIADIPFSNMLIAVPPLLLAVGIDFGIHSVNRYREEQAKGADPGPAMRTTTDQLLVAFFIVTGTTVIGFLANFTSVLAPIKDFGLVAAVGIIFTFWTFGVFMPAAKVELDRIRARTWLPTLSKKPLGSEDSSLGSVLRVGVIVGDNAPALFLLLVVALSIGSGAYATGVNTSFSQEDFLPPEENPDFLMELPEPFRPNEYSIRTQLNFLEEKFQATQGSQATVYVQGHLSQDDALEQMAGVAKDPPDSYVRTNGHAERTSIVTVIQDHAERDPEFRRLVQRNDANGNGIPDDNLDEVYDALFASSAGDQARNYLTEDRRSAQVVYTVEADASQDAVTADTRTMADRFRFDATATGSTLVFNVIAGLILESAVVSLIVAISGAAVFLVVAYWELEGHPSLGIANLFPVLVTVVLIAGTMRFLGIPFNALTATMLAITIGLGVDYSVHVTHRFADEREEHDLRTALDRTVRGTGGALFGSMVTTVSGIGVLALAIFPAIGQFGILTGLSISYAFLTSIIVLPPTLVVRDTIIHRDRPLVELFVPRWVYDARPA